MVGGGSLFVLLCMVAGVYTITFPYNLTTPYYIVNFPYSNPYCSVQALLRTCATQGVNCTETLTVITRMEWTNFTEIHYVAYNSTSPIKNMLRGVPAAPSILFPRNNNLYNATLVDNSEYYGISFTTRLYNGAIFQLNYTVPKNNISLTIPRENIGNVKECSFARMEYPNCSCDDYHSIIKDSLKISILMTNWTFLPFTATNVTTNETNPIRRKALQLSFWPSGTFDLDYYNLHRELDIFNVCDLLTLPLVLRGGIHIDANFFIAAEYDGEVRNIEQMMNSRFIRLDPDYPEEVIFPLQVYLYEFEDKVFYDPDFSVLLPAGSGRFDDESTGAGDGTADKREGSGGKGNTPLIVGLVVGLGLPAIMVVFVVVVIGVVLFMKMKASRERATMMKEGANQLGAGLAH